MEKNFSKGKLKLHDFFTIELKNYYGLNYSKKKDKFSFDIYFILPENLFITPPFYEINDFYKSFKNYIRYKTPVIQIREIIEKLNTINKFIMNKNEKSNKYSDIEVIKSEIKILVLSFCVLLKNNISIFYSIKDIDQFIKKYNFLKNKVKKIFLIFNIIYENSKKYYQRDFLDFIISSIEYILIYIEKFNIKILELLYNNFRKLFENKEISNNERNIFKIESSIIKEIKKFKKIKRNLNLDTQTTKKYLINSPKFLNRKAKLKKFFSSILFLDIKRGSASFAFEQIIFSFAAGLSMLLATIFTIFSQKKFGSTFPTSFTSIILLIIVLIYIMKDRLKDFLKFYLLVKLKKYIYNYNINIIDDRKRIIGIMKEGVWFFKSSMVNKKRRSLYNFLNNYFKDIYKNEFDIIHYRKNIKINNKIVKNSFKNFKINGIDDIIRFSLHNFTVKMDDPEKEITILNEKNKLEKVKTLKTYNIYLVLNYFYKKESNTDYYRIEFNRKGILNIEKISFS